MRKSESADMAGGVAAGVKGKVLNYNSDTQMRLDKALLAVAEWIEAEAGMFLGHAKMCVSDGGEGITVNLVDLGTGPERHGILSPRRSADFAFMVAATDIDAHELEHEIFHALEDSGAFLELEGDHHHHHHHGCDDPSHGEDCDCGGHHHHDHSHGV
ncbi:MAG: hypothetical protein GX224_04585 [Thermoplasmatales archaeon]|nr:hypothetical protein [Thermoplasmatales archaeon]